MLGLLRRFFADPAHQALAWAALGIAGIALAAAGLWLYQTGDNSGQAIRAQAVTPTPTVSVTATAPAATNTSAGVSPSPGATPSPSPSPSATPTTRAESRHESSGADAEPTPTPTPVPPTPAPTEPPVIAGGPYCDTTSAGSPATVIRIAGNFTVGGAAGPEGKTVTLLFDGVAGPSGATVTGGYGITYSIGSSSCANRPGASISLAYEGRVYPTGAAVPNGNSGALQLAPLTVD